MEKLLTKILTSENVVDNFHNNYQGAFKDWLLSIIPEIENCKNLKQDHPWHIYNCLDHLLHSVEAMNSQTTDLPIEIRNMLAYTMFLHDVGKPECFNRRYSKQYGREIDSYFNHNIASKKIALRVLPKLGFDNDTIRMIATLVEKHDIFMYIREKEDGNPHHKILTTELLKTEIDGLKNISNKINEFTLMKYLLMVGYSDNMAQNPAMTKDSFQLLKKMNQMLDTLTSIT